MSSMAEINGWIPVPEAAREHLGLTAQRLHQLIDRYEIPTIKAHTRLTLIRKSDVEKLSKMERPSGVHIERRQQPTKARRAKKTG